MISLVTGLLPRGLEKKSRGDLNWVTNMKEKKDPIKKIAAKKQTTDTENC